MYREAEYIEQIRSFHGYIPDIMGTKLDFLACDVENLEVRKVWEAVCNEVASLYALLNRFDKESEVAKLNASVPVSNVVVSEVLLDLLRQCEEYNYRTAGLFDITRGKADCLEINDENLFSLREGSIDFGGFAKGYVLEICKSKLVEAGITNAFVNFGNSTILGLGKHPCGDAWNVDVISPFTKASLETISLKNMTLSTSGNTPGYYGHIVNPKTGEQITGRKMVCVVSPSPLDAEVLSTAAMVADEADLKALEENFPDATIKIFNH